MTELENAVSELDKALAIPRPKSELSKVLGFIKEWAIVNPAYGVAVADAVKREYIKLAQQPFMEEDILSNGLTIICKRYGVPYKEQK